MDLTDYKEIRALLERHGFRFSKSLGQNFLTAAWVPQRIAEEAGLDEQTGVVEIGPGVGCLTVELAKRAGRVVSVELDRALLPVLAETLRGCENVEVVFGDACRLDLRALAAEKLAGLRPVVCANLPYNVTSPLLTALIEAGCFETITVMIQREVARRLCAGPGCADYGAFGLFVQWHCVPELLFDVPPSCFVPQPKVTSSVVRLTRRAAPPVSVRDEALLFRVIRAAFNQRRKTLVNALAAGLGLDKAQAEAAIVRAGFDPLVRGEAVGLGGFATISDEIHALRSVDL
ncbi:MAG: 16S rRNA (adenine(1518)-N(6)/adenine(1519)-N(6))-dimethyltransferase RsmA [Oscillospiraceae bacterium]|nr:16S rRNA (adenine(1518)-N(6)/adenine(1519)-N(6))-dimethyltransferase RsmA [Oscillospiraceae bacterium]